MAKETFDSPMITKRSVHHIAWVRSLLTEVGFLFDFMDVIRRMISNANEVSKVTLGEINSDMVDSRHE